MTGYIIQPWDFTVVRSVNVTDYDLPLECYSGESGSVTFEGKSKQDYSQYLFRLDVLDTMWKIKEAETGDSQSTKLSVTDQTGMLDGVITCPAFLNSYYDADLTGAMVFHLIGNLRTYNTNPDRQYGKYVYPYVGCKDYDLPTVLTGAGLKTADYTIYNKVSGSYRNVVTDVYKLVCDVVGVGAKLSMSVGPRVRGESGQSLLLTFTEYSGYSTATPVYFKDGHSYLLSESYDGDVCSAFIGIPSNPNSFPPPRANYCYYLDENMQMMTTNTDQINGYTKVETVSDTGDASTKASAAFGQNQWKHKVEFASDKVFHLNQPVKLMLERNVLNTAISKVTIKSGDDRYYYTCGELPQTAAQHIKANSWSYGKRLPHNPYIGQLAFV